MGVVNEIRYYINGQGHMTKMPASSKYGQILSRFYFAEVRWSWNLAGNIGDSSSTTFIELITLG